jgi:DNA-binding Lrp family transcriptional regulator
MSDAQDMSFLSMPDLDYDKKESFSIIHDHSWKHSTSLTSPSCNQLQIDGRLTNAELAQRVGLSAAPCWRRVRALEEGGFITGYRAEINRRKIGLGVLAFVRLDAERNNGDGTRALEEAIRKLPEVVSCHYISGTGTFELQVVAQDLDSFSRLRWAT